jgi:deoxyribodipyrimidine photo-lyase
VDLERPEAAARDLGVDASVAPVSPLYSGGTTQAKRTLRTFIDEKLLGYEESRNQPQTDRVSHMSKYLHFGQVSPVYVVRRVVESGAPSRERDAFVEEAVVRRELTMNFVHHTDDYDRYSCLPDWARESLAKHADDPREHTYSDDELVAGDTHDPYWNAAMKEMRDTGYMHNYMRMYWGKKILEWTPDPEEAFARTLRMNNRYFLDGRDPNSYANVAWCYGVHDRGWPERPVFGKVRYMNANGLRRKADPDAYVEKVDRIVERLAAARGA